VNDELMQLGHRARLEKAAGHSYFFGGEANANIPMLNPLPPLSGVAGRTKPMYHHRCTGHPEVVVSQPILNRPYRVSTAF
jgi:hypothetical protein